MIHARWAMLGALGCVVPELLDGTGNVAWFEAGAKIYSDEGIQYLGIPGLINAKSIIATLIIQVRTACVVFASYSLRAVPHPTFAHPGHPDELR